jgi:hypothetical protein
MLLIALAAPWLLGPGSPGPRAQWAASLSIARLQSRRQRMPILAAYLAEPIRGTRFLESLNDPVVQRAARGFVLAQVEGPEEYRYLAPTADVPPGGQLVFVGSDGRVLKRLSGYTRPADVIHAIAQVRDSLRPTSAPKTPNDHAWRATVLAMRGDVSGADRELHGAARTATPQARAEAFGALGDEWRARGRMELATHPLERAIALSQSGDQAVRWRLRLAMNRARMGDRDRAVRDLLACAEMPSVSEADRNALRFMASRFGGPVSLRPR